MCTNFGRLPLTPCHPARWKTQTPLLQSITSCRVGGKRWEPMAQAGSCAKYIRAQPVATARYSLRKARHHVTLQDLRQKHIVGIERREFLTRFCSTTFQNPAECESLRTIVRILFRVTTTRIKTVSVNSVWEKSACTETLDRRA